MWLTRGKTVSVLQMKDVFFFLFFLSVWLIAYGVATQALLHPNDPRIDWVFRRALYRPYLHIFGQIPLEEIDGKLWGKKSFCSQTYFNSMQTGKGLGTCQVCTWYLFGMYQ